MSDNKLFADYVDRANKNISEVCIIFDLGRAAEKMTDPNNVGESSAAWQKGPYISSPANCSPIDRSHPYIIRSSLESRVTAGLIYGDNPPRGEKGGVPIPLPERESRHSRVEPVVAKMAIITQFEILKDFLIQINGPINKKRSREWADRVENEILEGMGRITSRRNELVHGDDKVRDPSMREAVDYFHECRQLGGTFWVSFLEQLVQELKSRLNTFHE